MHLRNPFSQETRNLFLYVYACWKCGANGNGRGGMELHHIFGRVSYSPYNAAPLCHECHDLVSHSHDERLFLIRKTWTFLEQENYVQNAYDTNFLQWADKELGYAISKGT